MDSDALTVFWVLEESGHERIFGGLHQLDDALVDRVFVLVKPAVRVVRHLHNATDVARNHRGP